MDTPSTENAVVADLAERAAVLKPFTLEADTDAIVVTRVRDTERVAVTNLETYLPAPHAPRGTAVLHDPAHFVEYVNRLGNPTRTTVWADVDAGAVQAVLDDHRDYNTAGWREHRVVLQLRDDVDWRHWMSRDRRLMPQVEFAQHVEDALHTIIAPPAADMLEVASSLQAHRKADFSSATRLDNGDIQLAYHEETTAKAGKNGNLEVPRTFTLQLTPWVGCNLVEVDAQLRYQIDSGRLAIGYSLVRPDLVKRDVFESVVATMRDTLTTEAVVNGTAPDRLR